MIILLININISVKYFRNSKNKFKKLIYHFKLKINYK